MGGLGFGRVDGKHQFQILSPHEHLSIEKDSLLTIMLFQGELLGQKLTYAAEVVFTVKKHPKSAATVIEHEADTGVKTEAVNQPTQETGAGWGFPAELDHAMAVACVHPWSRAGNSAKVLRG